MKRVILKSPLLIILFVLGYLSKSEGQIITTFAGIGPDCTDPTGVNLSGDGGQATAATLSNMGNIALDTSGNIYIADLGNSRIRKVDRFGIITSIAGTGCCNTGDGGPATDARIEAEYLAFDKKGNLYLTESFSIRKINTSGIITTYAGGGTLSGDGVPATNAALNGPSQMVFDVFGNMIFADDKTNRIRKIDTNGIITTVAGNGYCGGPGGTGGYGGDGGPATLAELNFPTGVAIDNQGNIFIGDTYNYRIRRIDVITGNISTIAGNGPIYPVSGTYSGDGGPATAAYSGAVCGISFDNEGSLFFTDFSFSSIRKIDGTGVISTIAGTGTSGFAGDGAAATAAQICHPDWVSFDMCGNMYITDDWNNRIRIIRNASAVNYSSIIIYGSTNQSYGSVVTLNAILRNSGSNYSIAWKKNGVLFSTTSSPSTSYIKGNGTDTITAILTSDFNEYCQPSVYSNLLTVKQSVGIKNINEYPINIYPNPVINYLNINGLPSTLNYRILNAIGSAIQKGSLDPGDNKISARALLRGIYMLEIIDSSGEKIILKFYKE